MKKLLFLLLFIPAITQAQTVFEMQGVIPQIAYRVTFEGQSNSIGGGNKDSLFVPPLSLDDYDFTSIQQRVYMFNPPTHSYVKFLLGVNNRAANDASVVGYPSGTGTPYTFPAFGPEASFAARWMQETSLSDTLYIDKNSLDGQAIAAFQNGTRGNDSAVARRAVADAWLTAHGKTINDIGWVWLQGEGDYTASQSTYQTALNTLIDYKLSTGFIKPSTRIILTQIPGSSVNYGPGVASAKVSIVNARSPVARIVNYPDYSAGYALPDMLHLNSKGNYLIGNQIYKEVLQTSSKYLPNQNTGSGGVPANSFPSGGLVANWDLRSNLIDSSSNGLTLTNNNGATISSTGTTFTASSSQYLSGSTSNTLSGSLGLTVACWVRINGNSPSSQVLVSKYRTAGNNREYALYYGAGAMHFLISPNGTTEVEAMTQTSGTPVFPVDNSWHFVVGVWNGGSVKIYVDNVVGEVVGTASSIKSNSTAPFEVGADAFSPLTTYFLNGQMNRLRVWNRGLSTSEIAYLYNGGSGN